jgi:acetylornithine deacetylase/succinyl-diaminopimelate desuccinylase-like protein
MHRIFILLLILPFFSFAQGPISGKLEKRARKLMTDASTRDAAQLLCEIGGIQAPSGKEQKRAEAVAAKMKAIGLKQVRVTGIYNAVGVIPGSSDSVLVFVSTLDDLAGVAVLQQKSGNPVVQGNRVVGPGTNTSSTTVAMLKAAEHLVNNNRQPRHTLVFAAVAQEETGLKGMKEVYAEYKEKALGFVDILGDGQRISYGAIGIHWWKVNAYGEPGHTLRGGLPNINRGMGRAIDEIFKLPHVETYKEDYTRLNVGMIHSGTVYNHKPDSGYFTLDIRSLNADAIKEIEAAVRGTLERVSKEVETRFVMEPFQLTPGGQIPNALNSNLVTTSKAIAEWLGHEPALSKRGSSNMNVAIGGNTLAIGLGGDRGGQRGFTDEWADIPAMMRTAQHVYLLGAMLGGSEN